MLHSSRDALVVNFSIILTPKKCFFWPPENYVGRNYQSTEMKSKGCLGLCIAHWFQPKPYFFRFLPFRLLNQGEFEPFTPWHEILCFWPKIKNKGWLGLDIAHWFQLAYWFFRFPPLSLSNQGDLNPPPLVWKYVIWPENHK